MTGNREDYIKAIYELGGKEKRIGTKDIAFALKVSPPSVSEMIKKLVEEDFLEYELYKGVKLTKKGWEKAFHIKKRHLLWEVFLVEKLGYGWEEVHEAAENLEHITDPKLERRLEKFLKYPECCPHGTPLEDDAYTLNANSLESVLVGESAVINRLEDEPEILKFSKIFELNIGDKVKVINKKGNGIVEIKKDDINIEIKEDLAKNIYIR